MASNPGLFRCGDCGATVYMREVTHDDDAHEWPVCQGYFRIGMEDVSVHEPTQMAPAAEVDDVDPFRRGWPPWINPVQTSETLGRVTSLQKAVTTALDDADDPMAVAQWLRQRADEIEVGDGE